ncbi:hypothetical protein BURMUCGD2M_6317 [Burkholderia multivorans CGD2M]|uniref:Uncharacterized protein n=1 Tax=Burkholderia multivorans CGD2 TaxID=513052 RepID=B9BNR0_9BURK|nr:hypothetical protein BURMUCGD2_6330 [Burkholderia multivorans CGD2]EEE13597.1 hypothetical protein BURMUCGD2M_6317 [Burkholderia multivorans CGD2M]
MTCRRASAVHLRCAVDDRKLYFSIVRLLAIKETLIRAGRAVRRAPKEKPA